MPKINDKIILVLDNIRSVYNVGAIFRTADAAGVGKIYLIGTTPTPLDRFGRKRNDFHKCALGAEDSVVWEHVKTIAPLLRKLKKENYRIVALEQSTNSVSYKKVKSTERTALILGTEVTGLSQKVLGECDVIAEIPMRGVKESLNVSVATGIMLYALTD